MDAVVKRPGQQRSNWPTLKAGWSQHEAADRLGVSQPYNSQMENGWRPEPDSLALRAVGRLGVSPAALPLPSLSSQTVPLKPEELVSALGRLGYAGFAHLAKRGKMLNPALLATFHDLDWPWLVVSLARQLARRSLGVGLDEVLAELERSCGGGHALPGIDA